MPTERTVTISVHEDFINHLTRPRQIKDLAYIQTIGFMALWGNPDLVALNVHKDGEITGHYYRYIRNQDGTIDEDQKQHFFTMVSIPDRLTGKYSTHS